MAAKQKHTGQLPGKWGMAHGYEGATVKQMALIESLGMRLCGVEVTSDRARHLIEQLKAGLPLAQIAHENMITEGQYEPTPPPEKDLAWLEGEGVNLEGVETAYDVRVIMDAHENGKGFLTKTLAAITRAKTQAQLESAAADCKLAARVLPRQAVTRLREAYKAKRGSVAE